MIRGAKKSIDPFVISRDMEKNFFHLAPIQVSSSYKRLIGVLVELDVVYL